MQFGMIYEMPIGTVVIVENGKGLVFLGIGNQRDAVPSFERRETPLILQAHRELTEYFNGERMAFTLPLDLTGTEFQKKVWWALMQIPYGRTCSYRDIAVQIGSPRACRAVGMANHRNPIGIIIPCHRVIGADGKLVGYGGGLHIKEYLLKMEGSLLV